MLNHRATDYSDMVAHLKKDSVDILRTLTPDQVDLWHMATLISGEAGELLDAIKKHVVYNQACDFENVLEELGDLEFGMEGIRQLLGVSRQQVIQANINKLSKRYPSGGYTDIDAQTRADKLKELPHE